MHLDRLCELLGLQSGVTAKGLQARLAELGLDWPFPQYPGRQQKPPGLRAVVEKLICQLEAQRLGQIEGKLEKIDFIINRIKVSPRKTLGGGPPSLEALESQIASRLDRKFEQAHDWISKHR